MSKYALNIFTVLITWGILAIPVSMKAMMQEQEEECVQMDEDTLHALIQGISEVDFKELEEKIKFIVARMCDGKHRLNSEYNLPCIKCILSRPCSTAMDLFLNRATSLINEENNLQAKCNDIKQFCYGYHDCVHFLQGKISAQQIILYYLKPEESATECNELYAAGVNTAALRNGSAFPWTEKSYYATHRRTRAVQIYVKELGTCEEIISF